MLDRIITLDDIKTIGYVPLNQVIQGDCLEVIPYIEGGSIDCILTDIPYGTTNCKWDIIIPLDLMWIQLKLVIKDNGAIALFSSQPFTSRLVMSNPKMFRYEWIWEKTTPTGHLNAKKMPMKAHENICIFYKKLPVYNYIKTFGHKRKVSLASHKRATENNQTEIYNKSDNFADYDTTERYPRSVIVFSTDKQKCSLHPTQKPVELIEYLIKTYTNEGDTVLDFTAGSFTTAIACQNLNRNWICIEKEVKYCEIGLNRIL